MSFVVSRRHSAMFCSALLIAFASGFAGAGVPAVKPDPVAKAIQPLLDLGKSPGKERLESLRRQYQSALIVAPRDARVEYAYSLSLSKLFQSAESKDHLNRALEIQPDYFPANQAIVRELIRAQKFQEASERLRDMASRLQSSSSDHQEQARWLGLVVTSVVQTVGSPDGQRQFAFADQAIHAALSPVLAAAYARGAADFAIEYERLQEVLDQAKTTAETKQVAAKAAFDADQASDRSEIKTKQQDAQKTRKKWDDWITDQTRKSDDILKELEKKFEDNDRSITSQTNVVTSIRLQLERIARGQNLTPTSLPLQPNLLVPIAQPTPSQLERQLAVEELRLASLYNQQTNIANRGQAAVAQRQAIVKQYEKATGVVTKQLDTLDKWEQRNKIAADNAKKASDKKPANVATLDAKLKMLSTWDPADFETERRRMLDDLGVVEQPAS